MFLSLCVWVCCKFFVDLSFDVKNFFLSIKWLANKYWAVYNNGALDHLKNVLLVDFSKALYSQKCTLMSCLSVCTAVQAMLPPKYYRPPNHYPAWSPPSFGKTNTHDLFRFICILQFTFQKEIISVNTRDHSGRIPVYTLQILIQWVQTHKIYSFLFQCLFIFWH